VLAKEFDIYLSHYQHIFMNRTKVFYDRASSYAQGILRSKLSNIERMSEEFGMNYHQLQDFITESRWDHRQLMDEVSIEVSVSLPKRKLTGLLIDESGWEKKCAKGRVPTRIKPTAAGISVQAYMSGLGKEEWATLPVRNTAKRVLKGDYHFCTVFIWDRERNQILRRLLVIRRTVSPIQTRKWLARQHQIALNFPVSSFLMKEKIEHVDDIPLLSARDIKDMLVFKLFRQITDEQFVDTLIERHQRRQQDINYAYEKQKSNLLK
jgi:hypothetical protein